MGLVRSKESSESSFDDAPGDEEDTLHSISTRRSRVPSDPKRTRNSRATMRSVVRVSDNST